MDTLYVYTDGGSRGNPGPSAAGYLVKDSAGKILQICGKNLGINTNNFAEYSAVKLALEDLKESYPNTILILNLDSELAVRQLNGEYKIKNAAIAQFVESIRTLEKHFLSVEYNHIRRHRNTEADKIVNDVLDGKNVRTI